MEGDRESLSSYEDRLFDKVDDIADEIRDVAKDIQRLLQYVLIIGALNGTVTVGKIVDSAVSTTKADSVIGELRQGEHYSRAADSRENEPSPSKPTNRPL
jgi:hypothetical protein